MHTYTERERDTGTEREPKGKILSAIPVALLCMFVNVSGGEQGSCPKGNDVL